MKKLALYALGALIILLDMAALDDITTGNEPDYSLEYAILVVSALLFAGLILYLRNRRACTRQPKYPQHTITS